MRIGIGNTVPERVSLPGQSGGAPTPPGPPALAQVNNVYSMEFDGTNYIDLGDSDDLSFGNGTTDSPFSISAWINMDDATRFRIASKFNSSSNNEYIFTTSASDLLALNLYDESLGGHIGRI
jgi:hypothetical protein